MNLKKLVILMVGLGASQVSWSQSTVLSAKNDPVLFSAGSIVVRQSDVKAVTINYPYQQPGNSGKGLQSLSQLSGDSAYDEAMRQAEAIAKAFQESKMTGIYQLKLYVGPNEFEVWRQYQRDISQVFARHLHSQLEKEEEKFDLLIEKIFVGFGESGKEVINPVDLRDGQAPKEKDKIIDLRLRRFDGEIKVVANFVDRNLTPNSRTTLSFLEGKKNDHLRLRNVINLPRSTSLATEPELRCDLSRVRHSDDAFRMRNPGIKYETKAGCEISFRFF